MEKRLIGIIGVVLLIVVLVSVFVDEVKDKGYVETGVC